MSVKKFFLAIASLSIIAAISVVMAGGDKDVDNHLKKYKVVDLYQQYYDLQHQRDVADEKNEAQETRSWVENRKLKKLLISDSSNIKLHRSLVQNKIDKDTSHTDWLSIIIPLDKKMKAIQVELKNRGEPPPLS